MGQVTKSSPHSGWQKRSPQTHACPQSGGQLNRSSPHAASQRPSLQNDSNPQKQSLGQFVGASPHSEEHSPSPQKTSGGQKPQSCGHVPAFSPHAISHARSPQMQPSTQTRAVGSQDCPVLVQSEQSSPRVPHASLSAPIRHVPAAVQQPSGQVMSLHRVWRPSPPLPTGGDGSIDDRLHPTTSSIASTTCTAKLREVRGRIPSPIASVLRLRTDRNTTATVHSQRQARAR